LNLEEQLVQDAVSLIRFVSSIADLCEDRSSAPAHLPSSERFFAYIQELSNATGKYISESLKTKHTPAELLQLRNEIGSLRASWRFLHQFIKSSLDADTLRLPTALIQATIDRFREIPKFKNADFVIYHSDEFNYLNVKLDVFKQQADQISGLVSGPQFPLNLSIIGIPYSQASSLFWNCLIPHEMGHYVFGELALAVKFKKQIESELLVRLSATVTLEQRGQITELLAHWIEELFCDIFAVRILGLCFSIAFTELFDVAMFLDETGNLPVAATRGETEFRKYPPDLLRVREQTRVLQKDGWWDMALSLGSQYSNAMDASNKVPDSSFLCSALQVELKVDPVPVLGAFFAVLPKLELELEQCTVGLPNCSQDWKDSAETIERYLGLGIVPSTLRNREKKEEFHPSPVALLNSAYRFYVRSMPSLMSHIAKADPNEIESRVQWTRRVETWTAKAIEDVLLLNRRPSQ
jgi:hypothetical protein